MSLFTKARIDPVRDPLSFGNLAMELQFITPDELNEALLKQEQRLPIGEILVQLGKISEYQRDEILLEQRLRRTSDGSEVASIELRRQSRMIHAFKQHIAEIAVSAHAVAAVIDQTARGSKG